MSRHGETVDMRCITQGNTQAVCVYPKLTIVLDFYSCISYKVYMPLLLNISEY